MLSVKTNQQFEELANNNKLNKVNSLDFIYSSISKTNLDKIHLCKNLQNIFFNNSSIETLPIELYNYNMLNVALTSNKLIANTENFKIISSWTNLKVLYLDNNNLTDDNLEHVDFANLANLETLGLSNNKLTKIKKNIGLLNKLKELRLNHNNLVKLSKAIGRCTALENLNISNNKLASFPVTLTKLDKLKTFYKNNNIFQKDYIINNLDEEILCVQYTNYWFRVPAKKLIILKALDVFYYFEDLPNTLEVLIIHNLYTVPKNLPIGLIKLVLYKPQCNVKLIKLPYGCELVIL